MKHTLLVIILFSALSSIVYAQYAEQTVGAYGTFTSTMQPTVLKDTLGLKSGFGGGLRYRYLTKEANFRFALGAEYNSISGTTIFKDDLKQTTIRIAPAVDFGAFRYNFAPHLGVEFPISMISQKGSLLGSPVDTSFTRIGLALKAGFSIRVAWNVELNVDETYDMVNLIMKESGEQSMSNLRTLFGFSYYLTHARDNY